MGNDSLNPGELLGLMGVFSPHNRRTDTAECTTDVDFAVIAGARFWEIVDQNPRFGNELIRTIVRRHLGSQNASGLQSIAGAPARPASGNNPVAASRGVA